MIARTIRIIGKVQGVWYRASAKERAVELSLSGFVMNRNDGSVYAEVEGDEHNVEAFIKWCRQGPPLARVEEVVAADIEIQGFDGFEVKR